MNTQNKAFVLILFVACLSLVVLLPRNVNADEPVYEVFEFEGSSYTSMEEAEVNAHRKMEQELRGIFAANVYRFCKYDDNGTEIEHDYGIQRVIIIEDDGPAGIVVRRRARICVRMRVEGCN